MCVLFLFSVSVCLPFLTFRTNLGATEYQDLTLQFKPLRQRKFVETLTVRSGIGSVHVVLSGEGVSPSLKLTPESGLLDIGNVLQVRPRASRTCAVVAAD